MKIAKIESFICDAGWRPWVFVNVETDDGLVGWGECSDDRMPRSVAAAVGDLAEPLIGQDPRPVEKRYWTMYRIARQHLGGSASRAIAGIELALWDIKAQALGVSGVRAEGRPDAREDPPVLVALRHDASAKLRECWGAAACGRTTTSRRWARRS